MNTRKRKQEEQKEKVIPTITSSPEEQTTFWKENLKQLLNTTTNKIPDFETWIQPSSPLTKDLQLYENVYQEYELDKNELDSSCKTYSEEILFNNEKTTHLFQKIKKDEMTAFAWWITTTSTENKWKVNRVLTQAEIEQRWKHAFESYKNFNPEQTEWNPTTLKNKSLFLPNIGATSCLNSYVRSQMQSLAFTIDKIWHNNATNTPVLLQKGKEEEINNKIKKTKKEKELITWEQDLNWSISGFGTTAVQYYVKSGLTVTALHDEIAWSAALNYMKKSSCGIALWIGMNLKEVAEVVFQNNKTKLLELFNEKQVSTLLELLYAHREKLPSLTFAWQKPGDLISSPHTQGSCHIVITVGELVEQLAWNTTTTCTSIRNCLDFWKEQGIVSYNSGLATFHVVPLLYMQYLNPQWDLGVAVQAELNKVRAKLTDSAISASLIKMNPMDVCDSCNEQCMFIKTPTEGFCEVCVVNH